MNFQSRKGEVDAAVEDVALIEEVLEQLASGKMSRERAMHALDQVEHDGLRERIMQAVGSRTIRHAEQEALSSQLQAFEQRIETEKNTIDKAHTHYVTAQLAIYEGSRDTVKRLAAQGLNIAGKFVESALAQAKGQGRGQGF